METAVRFRLLDESLESFLFTMNNYSLSVTTEISPLFTKYFFNSLLLIVPYDTEKSTTDVCIQNI